MTLAPDAATQQGGFWRLYRAFLAARATLSMALAGAQFSGPMAFEPLRSEVLVLCSAYAVLTLLQAVLPLLHSGSVRAGLPSLGRFQWLASCGVDLIMFTALLALGGSGGPPAAALFVLPIMMSAVLASRRVGLAAAAAATLGSLGASLWLNWTAVDGSPPFVQTGLSGLGYFAIALLAAELATRLAREQIAARGSLALARQQSALNQIVIDEMQEGVLVVDRQLQVRAANPAARALLGELQALPDDPTSLASASAWSALAIAVREAWAGNGTTEGRDVVLSFTRAPARTLRLRLRWMRSGELADELLLVLLEDRAKLLARARQEKLAAMGRMSAGIAHEIRNPLAAISQANALLGEDLQSDPGVQRLIGLVASNVKRLQRIVDEVMLLAAPAGAPPSAMEAVETLRSVADDWSRTQCAHCLHVELPQAPLYVLFEPEHLRRVVVNLLDNAWRHSQQVAAPWLRLDVSVLDTDRLQCRVINPSEPLDPLVERHLFEPFFSTRSRGSGLGLYICRELCERYGARIDYQALQHEGQPCVAFTVTLRRAPP
jgi:two-component system, NtrC family, sensor histidine kinase PilS